MRRIGFSVIAGMAMVGALGGVAVSPAWAAAATSSDAASVEASAAQGSGITVGSTRNQATGDVLGLGYEQVVRIVGSAVVITEPQYRGGAELRRFEAKLDTSWPRDDRRDPPYYGQRNLEKIVKHDASRIAVLGGHIYVSRLYEFTDANGSRWDSVVSKYTTDGALKTRRDFPSHAITALDAYEFDNEQYLAIGLNRDGVRVARADVPGLPDFRAVHEDWTGSGREKYHSAYERDQVTVVKLGVDHTGNFMLVAGKMTYAHPAIVATDLRAGVEGVSAGEFMWSNNLRGAGDFEHWQFPDIIDFGSLGSSGRPVVAIAWPSLGRVSFLDASTGADWTWIDGATGAHVVRFFTGRDGIGYVAIGRDFDHQVGYETFTLATANERGEWETVREGKREGLAGILAHLTGGPRQGG